MKNEIEQRILHEISIREIKNTTTSIFVFEQNVRHEHVNGILNAILEHINEQYSLIGLEVYKYKKSIKFITKENWDNMPNNYLNPIEDTPFIMTNYDFNNYIEYHITYLIERYIELLCEKQLFNNSTNHLSNLCTQWISDENQNLLKIFKNLLKIIKEKQTEPC